MDAREAARRQKVIKDTLMGLTEILQSGLLQELDPEEEELLKTLICIGIHKFGVEP